MSGSLMTSDARCTREIKPSITIAKVALNKKRIRFTSWLGVNIWMKLLKCYIRSTASVFPAVVPTLWFCASRISYSTVCLFVSSWHWILPGFSDLVTVCFHLCLSSFWHFGSLVSSCLTTLPKLSCPVLMFSLTCSVLSRYFTMPVSVCHFSPSPPPSTCLILFPRDRDFVTYCARSHLVSDN